MKNKIKILLLIITSIIESILVLVSPIGINHGIEIIENFLKSRHLENYSIYSAATSAYVFIYLILIVTLTCWNFDGLFEIYNKRQKKNIRYKRKGVKKDGKKIL